MKFQNPTLSVGLRLALIGLALWTGACGSNDLTSSGTPTTEVETGTLLPMATQSFDIIVKGNGELDATLTSLTPQTTITVGLAIGQSANGSCGLLTDVENAKVGSTLPTAVVPGLYCVLLYDVGNVQGSDAFTLTVTHP